MNEFCNYLQLYHINDIININQNNITLRPGLKPLRFNTAEFEITPKAQHSDSGTLFEINTEITADLCNNSEKERYRTPTPCIIILHTSEKLIRLGELELPALVSVNSLLQKERLTLNIKTISSPL